MALQKQLVDIPFAGLNTKTAKGLVQPGASLELQNFVFDRLGAINARPGTTSITTPVAFSQGILGAGGRLFGSDGLNLYELDHGGTTFTSRGTYSTAVVSEVGSFDDISSTTVHSSDFAISGNVACVVYTTRVSVVVGNYTVRCLVYDLAKGRSLNSVTLSISGGLGTPQAARVISDGTYFIIVYVKNGGGLGLYYIPIASPATAPVAGTDLFASGLTTWGFDISSVGSRLIAAYPTDATHVGVCTFTPFGPSTTVSLATGTVAGTPGVVAMSVNGHVQVAANVGGGTGLVVYSLISSLATAGSFTFLAGAVDAGMPVGVETVADSQVTWTIGRNYGTPGGSGITYRSWWFVAQYNTAPGSLYYDVVGAIPASRPFVWNGFPHCWYSFSKSYSTGDTLTPEATYFLYRLDATNGAKIVALAQQRAGYNDSLQKANYAWRAPSAVGLYGTSPVTALISSSVEWAQPYNSLATGAAYTIGSHVTLTRLDNTSSMRGASDGSGRVTLTGGLTYEYDGEQVYEAGFLAAPQVYYAANFTTLGDMSDQTLYVIAIHSWYDGLGERHTSGPSNMLTVTLAGGTAAQRFTVYSSPYLFGQRGENSIYATVLAEYYVSTDGVNFYHAATTPAPRTATYTVGDIRSLAGLTSNRILYTVDGTLENGAPPPMVDVISRGKRLYGITSDGVVQYTKDRVDGEVMGWVPETMVRQCQKDDGAWWQLADLDGRLLAFSRNKVQWLSGEGLNDTGTSDTLSEAQLIPVDTGILPGTPVATAGDGVYYVSDLGVQMLGRSLQTENVGLPVLPDVAAKYSGLGSSINSIVVIPTKGQIWFHFNTQGWIYDYVSKTWATAYFSGDAALGYLYQGLALLNGVVCWLLNPRVRTSVLVQSATTGLDAAASVVSKVTTPWLRVGSIVGVERVYWVAINGEVLSLIAGGCADSLSIEVAYDYSDTFVTVYTGNLVDINNGASTTWATLRTFLGKRCTAVKFRITQTISSAGTPSLGYRFTGITLELGAKAGVAKVTAV